MKKMFAVLALAIAGLLARNWFALADSTVMDYVLEFDQLANTDADKACARLTEDFVADVDSRGPSGRELIQGGKPEFCDALRAQQLMLSTLGASSHSEYSNLVVTRGSFPWRRGTATYDSRTELRIPGVPQALVVVGREEITLVGGWWGGLKVSRVTGKGQLSTQ